MSRLLGVLTPRSPPGITPYTLLNAVVGIGAAMPLAEVCLLAMQRSHGCERAELYVSAANPPIQTAVAVGTAL